MYYNTTSAAGDLLAQYEQKALSQDDAFYSLFQRKKTLTIGQIHDHFKGKIPISSICRGVNTLTKKGLIAKTDKLVIGKFGRPVHVWKIQK